MDDNETLTAVNGMQASREKDVRAIFDALDDGTALDEYDDPQDALDELPLEVKIEKHVVIVLSTGGPHEEVDATLYDDGTIKSATFGAYWGSDKAITQLREEDALWRLAERYAEYVSEQ